MTTTSGMSEFPTEAIGALLDSVVGSTYPVGDAWEDERRLANVKRFEAVCDWVSGRIEDAQRLADSRLGSAAQLTSAVLYAARELRLNSDLEWEREDEAILEIYGYVKKEVPNDTGDEMV